MERRDSISICMISHEMPPVGGGGSQVVYNLSKELVKLGHSVDVLTMYFKGLPYEEIKEGVHIIRVQSLRRRIGYCSFFEMMSYVISVFPKMLSLIRENNYDLIHVHFGFPSGPLAYIAKKFFGIPYILSTHGSDVPGYNPFRLNFLHKLLRPLLTKIWRNANVLVAPSTKLKELILRCDTNVKVNVIPNGVDVEKFKPKESQKRGRIKVISVCRITKVKGLQYLIGALKILRGNFEVEIIGDGPYRKELEKTVNEQVRFLGFVDESNLLEYYADADIFVLPSLTESFGIAFLEAMACGLPVIGTEVGGIPEVVANGKTGLLVAPKDATALATALQTLIKDANLRKKMGVEGRHRVEHFYSWKNVTKRYLETYEEVIRQTCGSGGT